MAKKKRSKRETIRGMTTGYDELDPALWGLPQPPPREDEPDGEPDGVRKQPDGARKPDGHETEDDAGDPEDD